MKSLKKSGILREPYEATSDLSQILEVTSAE